MPTRLLTRSWTLPTALLLLAGMAGCGDDGSPTAGDASGEVAECSYPSAGDPAREVEAPPTEASAEGEVAATLATSVGDLGITLDPAAAPCTVGSFVSLAEQDYFDDTTCHRLTTQGIFVLQCGDPTGTGTGGPGYSFADEVTEDATYPAGTVAMANAGPDTNGSQFFLVYEDTELPPQYTVFGAVDEDALTTLQEVAEAGTTSGTPDGPPKTEVRIEDVTLD